MPSVYDLKPRFQALLRPAIARLARKGVTANTVTLAALAGSMLVGFAFTHANDHRSLLLVLPAWLFVRMALNAIDGMMARELAMASNLGAFLNELGDVVSDAALYLPFAWIHPPSRAVVFLFTGLAVLGEFSGVLAKSLGASRRYDGPMGKSDRALWVGLLAVVAWFAPGTIEYWHWAFGVLALLAFATCLNRIARALDELEDRAQGRTS